MADRDDLEKLRPVAEETLGGLRADDALRRRILKAADGEPVRHKSPAVPVRMLVPAACAVLIAALGAARLSETPRPTGLAGRNAAPDAADTFAAEDGGAVLIAEEPAPVLGAASAGANGARDVPADAAQGRQMADLSGTTLRKAVRTRTLFEEGDPEIPVVAVNGAVYRMLREPAVLSDAQAGDEVGTVRETTEHPSLASREALQGGLSNCCAGGSVIRAVRGLSTGTAVACEAGGVLRLFQRVSYAGTGAAGLRLEDTLDIRGKVTEMTLSGAGTLTGDEAQAAADALLDGARLAAADAEPGSRTLTIRLQSGLLLQMTVDGERLVACGAWTCTGLLDRFR